MKERKKDEEKRIEKNKVVGQSDDKTVLFVVAVVVVNFKGQFTRAKQRWS